RLLLADGGERRVLDYSHFVPGDTEDSGKRVGICWDVDHFFSSGGDLLHVSGAGDSSIVVETVE
ncbi:MAG: hypothetical protein AB2825_07620, partial [Candidatus Thiodiazotropha endolucinida]